MDSFFWLATAIIQTVFCWYINVAAQAIHFWTEVLWNLFSDTDNIVIFVNMTTAR